MVVLVLVDLLLLFAWFLSIFLALAWGEMASYPLDGDKSGLAGLGMLPLFMMGRWPLLAVALVAGAYRGGFPELPGGKGTQALILLAAHLALGLLSLHGSNWIIQAIQNSQPGPLKLGWVFGLLLPLATFAVAFFGLHRTWIPKHQVLTAIFLVLLVWSHYGLWRKGYVRAPASAPVESAR